MVSTLLLPPIVIKNVVIPGMIFWYFRRLPRSIRYHFAVKFILLLAHSNVMSFIDIGFYNIYLVRSAFALGSFASVGIALFLHRFFFNRDLQWLKVFCVPAMIMGVLSISTPWVVQGMDGRNSIGGFLYPYFKYAPMVSILAYYLVTIPDAWKSRGLEAFQKRAILITYAISVLLIYSTNLVYPQITGRSDLSGFGAYWILIPGLVTMWIIVSSRTEDLSFRSEHERMQIEEKGISEMTFIGLGKQVLGDYRELAKRGGGAKANLSHEEFHTKLSLTRLDGVPEVIGELPQNLVIGQQRQIVQLTEEIKRLSPLASASLLQAPVNRKRNVAPLYLVQIERIIQEDRTGLPIDWEVILSYPRSRISLIEGSLTVTDERENTELFTGHVERIPTINNGTYEFVLYQKSGPGVYSRYRITAKLMDNNGQKEDNAG